MLFSTLTFLVATAMALPHTSNPMHALSTRAIFPNCPVGNIQVPLRGQNLTVPAGEKTPLIMLGRGTQNYTCTNNAYVAAGAVANLYDVGCFFTATGLDAGGFSAALTTMAKDHLPYPDTWNLPVAIKHYFVKLPNATAASPGFFAASGQVIAAKVNGVKAPVDPASHVDWLQLGAVAGQGTLAKSVFRLDTAGGQPPATCSDAGTTLTVPYAAMYWFTK